MGGSGVGPPGGDCYLEEVVTWSSLLLGGVLGGGCYLEVSLEELLLHGHHILARVLPMFIAFLRRHLSSQPEFIQILLRVSNKRKISKAKFKT